MRVKHRIFGLFNINFYLKERHYCDCEEKIAIEGADCKNFEQRTETKYRPQGSNKQKRCLGEKPKKTKEPKKNKKNKKPKKTIFWNSCSRPPPNPRPLENCFFCFFWVRLFFCFFWFLWFFSLDPWIFP